MRTSLLRLPDLAALRAAAVVSGRPAVLAPVVAARQAPPPRRRPARKAATPAQA